LLGKGLANKHIVAKEFGDPDVRRLLDRVKQLVALVAGPESSYITGRILSWMAEWMPESKEK